MAKPIPSSPQHDAIVLEIASLTSQRDAMSTSASLQDSVIAQKQLVDDAFKNLMNWYNDSVIGKYDLERKAINGSFIISPFVEADLTNVSGNPPTGRLTPAPPAQNIVRISEFDGTAYSGLDTNNEQQHILNQSLYETYLQSGVSGGSPSVSGTAVTVSNLTSSSTTLDVTDSASLSLSINDVLVVFSGGDASVVKISSIITSPSSPPPYDYSLGIQVIIPPSGTIASGSGFSGGFSGFSNSERTAKVASIANRQPLMNSLISSLETEINGRISNLTTSISALSTNDDPYAGIENTTASSNASNSNSFLNSYMISTDVSDTGLSSLLSERSSRSAELISRLSQIINAYTLRTENFFEQRYQTANSRGNTYRGTLRSLSNAQNVKTLCLDQAAGLQGTIDALNAIL